MRLEIAKMLAGKREESMLARFYEVFIMSAAALSLLPMIFKQGEVPYAVQLIDHITVYILFLDYFLIGWFMIKHRDLKLPGHLLLIQ